jgi:hypothetical protein
MEPTKKNCEDAPSCATKTTQRVNNSAASANAGIPKRLRRLKWNEFVSHGDFVADERRGFEPWAGPGGFRADAFVNPIYRQHESRSTATQKLK